jgi:uncharacterized cupredoxin-like copper-binding protein
MIREITMRSLFWSLPFAAVVAVILWIPLPVAAAPQTRHFTVDASQFEFMESRFEVNYGDRVVITLTAADVVHGFYLDGYGIDQSVTPGISQQIEFVADQVGKFRYRCSVNCGSLHPFMIGELVVGPNMGFGKAVAVLSVSFFVMLVFLWKTKGLAHVAGHEIT